MSWRRHFPQISRWLIICKTRTVDTVLVLHYSAERKYFIIKRQNKKHRSKWTVSMECGNDLSSRQVTLQVLSARQSLTSVFGMRTGGPLRYHHHNGYIICILYTGYIRLFSVEHWQLHRSVYHNLFLFRTFGLFLSEYLLFIYAISYCFCLFFFQNKHSTY